MNSEIKPVNIKTAEERIHTLAIDDKSVWCNAYFDEVQELRAALEALQAENAKLKESAKTLDEMLSKVIDERNNAEQNMCKFRAESAAQAKRIAELELSNTLHELSRGTTKEEMIKKIAFLQNQAEEMLTAMRRAVLALAFAAESSNAMKDDYQALSKAIDKAVSAQKGAE